MKSNILKQGVIMKFFTCSIAAALALSTFAVAGGDIEPVVAPIEEVAPDVSGFYIGGAYSDISLETDSHYYNDGYEEIGSLESDFGGYMLLAGYQYNEYIAFEGRYWGSYHKTSVKWEEYLRDGQEPGEDGSFSYECGDLSAWGIFLKPMYPVSDNFSVYGLLGYGNTSLDMSLYGEDDGEFEVIDESGFQWGIGAAYVYNEDISFFVDYVQLASDADESHEWYPWEYVEWESSLYTINVGVTYKF